MTDPTIIILALTMYFCSTPDGRIDYHLDTETCSDGSKPHEWKFNLGVRAPTGLKDIVQIDVDGRRIFTMHEDGETAQVPAFNADENARRFWRALHDNLPDVCNAMEKFKK